MRTDLTANLARRAEELLSDGEWHSYEKTLRAMIKVVPPGIAMRRNEQDRVHTNSSHKTPAPAQRKYDRSDDDKIYSGARSIVRDFLNNTRVFETDMPGSHIVGAAHDRKVRLIGKHRYMLGDPTLARAERLEKDLALEREKVSRMRAYLVQIGHARAARRLAPKSRDDDD